MSYRDQNSPNANIGNQVQMGANVKGTGKRGVPSAIALENRTESFPAVENTQGTKPSRGKSKQAPPANRRLGAVENPDGKPNRQGKY